ncbi:hypothetical protein ACFCV9_04915 [Streptomyces sp. NPDC056367]|uniref:hypothetical protein n=1 Tax=unclassified Streptomyces TaxID=2593676 RepID=UPI0035D7F984
MRAHFDSSIAEMPFLLRFQEPGPAPLSITGQYDPRSQQWVHPDQVPQSASTRSTSRPTTRTTTQPTNRSTTRGTYHFNSSDTDSDYMPDSSFDYQGDSDFDTAWD